MPRGASDAAACKIEVPVHIRPARASDREFILGLAVRLIEFGTVPGRDPAQMMARDGAVLADALEQPS